ncbi:putative transmembrane protein [Rhizoctonia solani 123E]|uniref:Putative transmembrane protein n=1 Tax=Rhizoctonia solani 123E TaxID=1423351 RepID=A0A074RMQ7_9AGAM|nr:putative transmembrane protein [Rhizoctonia solani 123E]
MHCSNLKTILSSTSRVSQRSPCLHASSTLGLYGPCLTRTRSFHIPTYKKHHAEPTAIERTGTFYQGPLSTTFRNLKLFSLSSLSLASALTPFIFLIDAPLSLSARIALAAAALGTSLSSTTLIAWCGKPYVVSMRRAPGSDAVELTTTDVFLRERHTTVLDPRFFQSTSRPFATWEIPESFTADSDSNSQRSAGSVEPVAVTRDGLGNIVGQCVVQWKERDGQLSGVMRVEGGAIRHFNVHEELLKDHI